jgi:hypothetical protein
MSWFPAFSGFVTLLRLGLVRPAIGDEGEFMCCAGIRAGVQSSEID